ncbi:hypothetical protein EXIGLDRAFT_817146, partial [Exidia glandulosa HHB12029]
VEHPDGPDADATPDSAFGLFKMRIYQKIYGIVFASLKDHSLFGSAATCGDQSIRVLWPGVLIVSMDGEESYYFCASKATGAKVPCSCCLCKKEDLSRLTLKSRPRTVADMKAVYLYAQTLPSKTAREAYLSASGLRDVPHFLWDFGNSDPYLARSYDELHFDDEGKWGKHLWPLTLERLAALGCSKQFDQLCAACTVCPTSCATHLSHYVQRVTTTYGKNFNFYKQHMCAHVVDEVQATGTLNHKTTKIGEAIMQELKEDYGATNFKSTVDHQVCMTDSDMEAVARIRTTINEYNALLNSDIDLADDDEDEIETQNTEEDSWHFSAADGDWTDPHAFQEAKRHDPAYSHFHNRLVTALTSALDAPMDPLTTIRFYKCLYLYFQSQEDFRQGFDILRCNERFHGQPRYDCITYRTADGYLGFGRLRHIIRCRLSHKRCIDLAVITAFSASRWKPNTYWEDCSVYEEDTIFSFVLLSDVFRGALMCPTFGSDHVRTYYLMDDVDSDMFLRLNQL